MKPYSDSNCHESRRPATKHQAAVLVFSPSAVVNVVRCSRSAQCREHNAFTDACRYLIRLQKGCADRGLSPAAHFADLVTVGTGYHFSTKDSYRFSIEKKWVEKSLLSGKSDTVFAATETSAWRLGTRYRVGPGEVDSVDSAEGDR
ncbi:hypothetical protein Bbelb_169840 [Branchiostoma belcheri]|nr:hypothetical protein Bbelb_169840 [Branchiostoma belcheri]